MFEHFNKMWKEERAEKKRKWKRNSFVFVVVAVGISPFYRNVRTRFLFAFGLWSTLYNTSNNILKLSIQWTSIFMLILLRLNFSPFVICSCFGPSISILNPFIHWTNWCTHLHASFAVVVGLIFIFLIVKKRQPNRCF